MRHLIPPLENEPNYSLASSYLDGLRQINVPFDTVVRRAVTAPKELSVITDIIGSKEDKFSRTFGKLWYDSITDKWCVAERWEAFQ